MANKTITAPLGFRVGSASCGLKSDNALDVAVLVCDFPAVTAGVFTTNKVFAAPVALCRERLVGGRARALVVNAGNANACTGPGGLDDARDMTARLGQSLDIPAEKVLVASTGIIGHRLEMGKVLSGIDAAVANLSRSARAGRDFARAIMTTDRSEKMAFRQIKVGRSVVRIGGVAKGAGMIAPNMATMLCFITTDAAISSSLLSRLLKRSVATSFNAITVDNHASTNDSAIIMASGLAGNATLKTTASAGKFAKALDGVCLDLALQMVCDGEGATKRMDVRIRGARSLADARTAGFAIANSPLVKCALFGGDPNWGRIVYAVGSCGVDCNQERIDCKIGPIFVFRKGKPVAAETSRLGKIMAGKVVEFTVDLHMGKSQFTCYGCDLTYDYVRTNAEYHT